MTDQLAALRSDVIAAVQQELTRYNEVVASEFQRLRAELAAEKTARASTDEQVLVLMPAVERSQASNSAFQTEIQRVLEVRLGEFVTLSRRRQEDVDIRIGRIADEVNLGLVAAVESAAAPIVKELEHRQVDLENELATLDRSVRKFDGQAARIVEHINAIAEATDGRIDEVSAQITDEIDGRLSALATRLDEVSAQAARHQAEVGNVVGSRVDQAESRLNERLLTTEARINETVGQRIADIDAFVGRVGVSLDEAVTMLSNRIADIDTRFHELNRSIDSFATRLDAVDIDALDEMKDRFSAVAGEVELLRIEAERFEKSMGDTMDKAVGRIVELETQLQEQHLDVETAVQLERLEEVERALIALDPNQFVRRSDAGAGSSNGMNGRSNGSSNGYSSVASDSAPSVDPFEDYEPSDAITNSPSAASSTRAVGAATSPSASAPLSAPTPFSPPVSAQH